MVNIKDKAISRLDPNNCVIFPESIVTTDVLIKMASRDIKMASRDEKTDEVGAEK